MTGGCDRGQDRRPTRSGSARDRRHSRRTLVPRCRTAEPEPSNGCHRRRPRRPRWARRCRTMPRRLSLVEDVGQPVAEMDALARKSGRDDREKIAAMERQSRRAVELLAPRIDAAPSGACAHPAGGMMSDKRTHSVAVAPRAEAKTAQDAHRVRTHVNVAADLGLFRGPAGQRPLKRPLSSSNSSSFI